MQRALSPIAAVLALLAGGCAGSPPAAHVAAAAAEPVLEESPKETVWAKADGSYAAFGDFERAEAACGGVHGELPDVSAGPGTRRAYAECMKTQGWVRVRIP